jgi:prepilin peptidase CpaA
LVRPSELVVLGTLAAGAGIAAAIDLRTRRVPNPLTASLTASGLVFAAAGISGLSVSASIVGFVLGLALMLPGHLFGATGAGDVKLFAAAGSLLGPAPIVTAFFYTAIAGGLLALVVAVRRRRLQRTLNGAVQLVATAAANSSAIAGPLENNRFAYAPAIAVGTLIAALGR